MMIPFYSLGLVFLRIGLVTLGAEVGCRYLYWWLTVRDDRGEDRRTNPLVPLLLGVAFYGAASVVTGIVVLIRGQIAMPSTGSFYYGGAAVILDAASVSAIICCSRMFHTISAGYICGRFFLRVLVIAALVPLVVYLRTGTML
jgi:hypothetical protein